MAYRSRLLITHAVVALLACVASSGAFAQAAPLTPSDVRANLNKFRDALRDWFVGQHMVPILTPREQDVGFVYVPATLELYGKRSDCFPTLPAPDFQPRSISEFRSVDTGSLAAGLGIESVGDAKVAGSVGRMTAIVYRDVRMRSVSTVELRSAFDAAKCPELVDVMAGQSVRVRQPVQPLFVVARVWVGKPEIIIDAGSSAQVNANVSGLKALLQKLSLDFNAQVEGGAGQSKRVILRAVHEVPIAVSPAFVPRYFPTFTMGGGTAQSVQPSEVTWEEFNPEQTPSQLTLVRSYLVPARAEP